MYTARSWNGNNTPGGTPVSMETIQPDGALGGPLVKSEAWFFGTFRYTKRSTGISRNATQLDNLRALVPSFEPFDNEGRLRYYSLKVSTRFGPNHQFQVLTQRDRNREDTNFQVNGGNFEVTAAGGSTHAARVTSVWGTQLTTRVLASYNDKGSNPSVDVFVTSNRWNWFVYRGIEFDVTKRTKTIQLIANYTRAWQHLAGTCPGFLENRNVRVGVLTERQEIAVGTLRLHRVARARETQPGHAGDSDWAVETLARPSWSATGAVSPGFGDVSTLRSAYCRS